jgi:glycosyltransferase involved in cell wall biosynthesis
MSNTSTETLPGVSIIIPVCNAQDSIDKLLDSLLALDYPRELVEVIVVDNNSTDETKDIVKRFAVKLLQENATQSSYAARNKGIRIAKGAILAFIDADCIAGEQWLREGVSALQSNSADIAGGKVEFYYSERKTAAELWDSIIFLQTESSIKNRSEAPTANLFVKAPVFDGVGLFPSHVRSGGDAQWTYKASKQGFSLVYAPKAVVKHPARPLKELLKKKFRTGTGKPHQRLSKGHSLWHEVLFITYLMLFIGIPLAEVRKKVKETKIPEVRDKFLRILTVAYLCKISSRLGAFIELVRILLGRSPKCTVS